MSETDLVTTAQVARLLRKSPRTIARWATAGVLIPAFTSPTGGAMLFHRADVQAKARELIALAPDLSAEVAS